MSYYDYECQWCAGKRPTTANAEQMKAYVRGYKDGTRDAGEGVARVPEHGEAFYLLGYHDGAMVACGLASPVVPEASAAGAGAR